MTLGGGIGGSVVSSGAVWWLQRIDNGIECGGIWRSEVRLKTHREGYRVVQ